jgi:hypothetical protein
MSALYDLMRSKGISMGSVARATRVDKFDVSHYVHHQYEKIGKVKRKKIRLHFISIGILSKPKPRPKCECPICHKVHTQSKQHASTIQFQTADKLSASK